MAGKNAPWRAKMEITDLDAGQLKVKGKGSKERKVSFGNRCKKAILRYLTTFRPESDSPRLFLNQDGEPLTYNALLLMLRRLGKKAGVPRLHPHLSRHSFAVRFLVNVGDLASLQTILGHTTIVVTQQYLHLAQAQIKEIHLRNSPMDRLAIHTGKRNGRVSKSS